MDMDDVVARCERNIRQALKDYRRHTSQTEQLDDVSDSFIERLARDSAEAKQELRELFRKSPVWNEELDALVINGTRTHDPDPQRITDLAKEILYAPMHCGDVDRYVDIRFAIWYFTSIGKGEEPSTQSIEAIKTLAPKAYAPGKKPSRIFRALCAALGVADESKGSEFQKLYAQFADELTSRKIGFKLFVSINPAHFITMSNPKCDNRGDTLTSCHSFNSTDYRYNNGCSGYARDNYSFIVFTVADPTDEETLNNRKTTRQVFAYKPGNGVLLQSRMYNTSGGVYGASEDSKLYRDLVQREISMLEDAPNLWKTCKYYDNDKLTIDAGYGFGGYEDWMYQNFDCHLSIRNDHADDYEKFRIGTWGLCIRCGEEINSGLYCDDCKDDGNRCYCEHCEDGVDNEDDLYCVHNSDGGELLVCQFCRDNYYTQCNECYEYYPDDDMTEVGDDQICPRCMTNFDMCDICEEYHRRTWPLIDYRGHEEQVCESCADDNCDVCDDCGDYVRCGDAIPAHGENGDEITICPRCAESNYSRCPDCGEYFHDSWMLEGFCEECHAQREEDNDDEKEEISA